ncbi:MAG TPA: VIT1/CCC1 transporter family protein [Candidatus Binatia bacterium]|jgi:predicted membrane protein (TIGR00267 family)|nr:VIT1/CCC1 transporter family protein [Candidatus Binatia bacterium]
MRKVHHRHLQDGLLTSIRELIFGLEDSLVSTLGVVVGIGAGTQDARVVILSGVVLVVVEALSMAAGSFISSKSHKQMLLQAIGEEEYEIETEPEAETEELRGMYKARGFTEPEIEILVRRITSDKKLWLEEMMAKELKINSTDLEQPNKSAVVMFLSYLAGGIVPILPFALLRVPDAMIVSTVLTLIALFAVGFFKGRMLAHDGWKSGVELVAISAAAALIGYGIGKGAGSLFGFAIH